MAKREVDRAKTAKALRKLRKVAARTAEPDAPKLTAWEQDFVAGVSTRLETYGSAFRDLSKGRAEEALSERQTAVARVIDRKTRPKKPKPDSATGQAAEAGTKTPRDARRDELNPNGFRRSTFKPKAPPASRARVRHVEDDLPGDAGLEAPGSAPSLKVVASRAAAQRPRRQARPPAMRDAAKPAPAPRLRVIPGGKPD